MSSKTLLVKSASNVFPVSATADEESDAVSCSWVADSPNSRRKNSVLASHNSTGAYWSDISKHMTPRSAPRPARNSLPRSSQPFSSEPRPARKAVVCSDSPPVHSQAMLIHRHSLPELARVEGGEEESVEGAAVKIENWLRHGSVAGPSRRFVQC
mmetsp:Transcript_32411/g.65052  ORF Transcript_32411/g.65052 Transcript_32411/m.65052 type:complete len:155 (-) Transcript_32411:39-503(-)